MIKKSIQESILVKSLILENEELLSSVEKAIELIVRQFQEGHRLWLCGNGGSAADAQHIAAELSGRYKYDRKPLPAEALTVNTSYLTAVANDYDFSMVFSRLVEAHGRNGDVLIAISTSGNSSNVVNAARVAKDLGLYIVGMTGRQGGKLATFCDILLNVPSDNTPRIQEAHIMLGHIICEEIEKRLFPS
jgi:D-sedoheptulose 7-phosphate isomerase